MMEKERVSRQEALEEDRPDVYCIMAGRAVVTEY
jgi:hypothetical protein